MQILFYTCVSIIFLISQIHEYAAKKVLKPSFNPYCTTRSRCKPDCSCEVFPNCELVTMDETIRSSILFYHNQIRDIESTAEPQPAGMTLLQYDMELEEISTCWAARCEDEYSECFLTSRFSETSQSVVQLTLEDDQQPNVFLWMEVMNNFLGTVRTLSAETIQSLPAGEEGEELHNYVQLMSDRILAVGCAWSERNKVLTLVCTYGPRGPLQGEPIYKTGYVCSRCPGGYACDFTKPFEQLCKLRIYSAVPSVATEATSQLDTPPPPPPLPSLPEDPTNDYFMSQAQIPLPPPPPKLPEYPPLELQPSYSPTPPHPQQPSYPQQSSYPQPPSYTHQPFYPQQPPYPQQTIPPPLPPSSGEGNKCPTESTNTSSTTFGTPNRKAGVDSAGETQHIGIISLSIGLIVKLVELF